jgi:hypothetical protein
MKFKNIFLKNIILKTLKKNLNDYLIIFIFLILFTLFVLSLSKYILAYKNNQNLSVDYKYGVIDISKVIYSFEDIYLALIQTKQEIKNSYNEIYNLDKSLELQFIKEMEIYSNNILSNQKKLEKQLSENLLKSKEIDQQLKNKIIELKNKIEKNIIQKRKQTQDIIYNYEKELYSQLNQTIYNVQQNYHQKIKSEIDNLYKKYKTELDNYKVSLNEIYKNEITNINLKLTNTSIYDPKREELLNKLELIKSKQEELYKSKSQEIEKELYQKQKEITNKYEQQYKQEVKEILNQYHKNYNIKKQQIIDEYNNYVSKLEQEYNKNLREIIKSQNNEALKELYTNYNQEFQKANEKIRQYQQKLAKKYNLLYTQKLINLNNKISNLNEKLNNLNYQILKNIEPYIEEIAKLYDVDFVFINYISYNKNNVVNLTDALIQKIKKHK